MPDHMRIGNYLYFTGRWRGIVMEWASKNLHDNSRFPYAHDVTLPQHRLNEGEMFRPLQGQYPVWYFLVGQAANLNNLQALLKHKRPPYTRPAIVHGLTSVKGLFCAGLVESSLEEDYARVNTSQGIAYLVRDRAEEDKLRYFQTSLFKVVSTLRPEYVDEGLC